MTAGPAVSGFGRSERRWTARDQRLAVALAGGATQAEAAAAAGVSERTVRRRCTDADFAELVDQARDATAGRLLDVLTVSGLAAANRLAAIIDDANTSGPVVVSAARALLAEARRWHDSVELAERVAALEAALAARDGLRLVP